MDSGTAGCEGNAPQHSDGCSSPSLTQQQAGGASHEVHERLFLSLPAVLCDSQRRDACAPDGNDGCAATIRATVAIGYHYCNVNLEVACELLTNTAGALVGIFGKEENRLTRAV